MRAPKSEVHNVVGLSGGSWGVTMLGYARPFDPCGLVNYIKTLPTWGETQAWSKTCGKGTGTFGNVNNDCFKSWSKDITKWFHELVPPRGRKPKIEINSWVGTTFGDGPFGRTVQVLVQSDPCYFTGWSAKSSHTASCLFDAGEVRCDNDLNAPIPEGQWDFGKCQIEPNGEPERPASPLDVLALSSAAWAGVTKIKGGFLAITGRKTTPFVSCDDSRPKRQEEQQEQQEIRQQREQQEAQPYDEQPIRTQFCDPGCECNLPVGALDVIRRNFKGPVHQSIVFDYSDNAGNIEKSIKECADKWRNVKNWTITKAVDRPWGFSLLLRNLERDEHNEFATRVVFVMHVVVFKGATQLADLVKKFPTTTATGTPNYFTNAKKSVFLGLGTKLRTDWNASYYEQEYRGFLLPHLTQLFTTPVADAKAQILAAAPLGVFDFLQMQNHQVSQALNPL